MIVLKRPYKRNNTELLHTELKQKFGDRYLSMDSSDDGLIIRLTDERPGDEIDLTLVLDGHNSESRTKRQEKAADKGNAFRRLRSLDMDALRAKVSKPAQRDELLNDILNILEDLQKQLLED